MKQLINKIGIIAIVLLVFAACDNSEYEMDNLFPSAYHRMTSIQDKSDGDIILYESGDDGQMTFSVLRTGSDPSLPAEVGIETMTQEELESYNADFQLVDPSLYTVPKTVSFAPDERYKDIVVTFTAENIVRLKELISALESDEKCYIALKIKDIGHGAVYEEKNYILRKVTITQPSVQIVGSVDSKEDNPTWIDIATNPEISFSLKLDIANNWNFRCHLVYNPDLIEAYNAKYGTSFQPLPFPDNILIENSEVEFTKGEGNGDVNPKLKINNPDFNGAGLYLVPIEAQSETFQSEVYYIVLENRVNLREDMLYAPFTVTYDGSWWTGLLDNDWDTFWHTPWKEPKYYNSEYGHWFQIKFDTPLKYGFRLKYWTRNYNPVLPIEIKICASTDNGETWTVVDQRSSDLCGIASSWLSPAYESLTSPITHLRFSIMKSNNGRCGIDSGASSALSGFRVWGK